MKNALIHCMPALPTIEWPRDIRINLDVRIRK